MLFRIWGGGLMIPSISPAICAFNDNLTQTQLDLNSHWKFGRQTPWRLLVILMHSKKKKNLEKLNFFLFWLAG